MKTADNVGTENFSFQLDEFYLDLQEDGSKVSILSQEEITRRPFPGLRPFKTAEFQLFNGRVGQAEELIKRLKRNRFLAVIGSSGTGKSSLVRAGLIPQLFGGYLHGAGSKWNVAICRPGKNPVENLAVALASIKAAKRTPAAIAQNFEEIEPRLSSSIYGLLDVKEMLDGENKTANADEYPSNLLVIIDQFEELFRFDRKDLDNENVENQFVNLLLKASLDPGNAVYVIITMRSEFLGDCVKYRGLPEAINEGQYLVPQLTRNELKEVIENPIRLAGKTIDPSLVELLVNEIEESKLKENLDQLPILQHALMRTYNEAMSHGAETAIRYEHYRNIGEMEKALANHAESKFNDLGSTNGDSKTLSKKQQLAKLVFQSLTEMSLGLKGGRRPTGLRNIYAIAASLNASPQEVDEVVNHFRDSDTSFIMPPINTPLYPNLIVDISHESLMRNWARLTEWMTDEMKYGNLYKRLNERRILHEYDNEEWLRGVLLRELLDWKDSWANNAAWAAKYHQVPKNLNDASVHEGLYKKNLAFLIDSNEQSELQKKREAKELQENFAREQRMQSAKKRATVLTIAALVSLLFGAWAFAERNNARQQGRIASEQKKAADDNAVKAENLKKIAEMSAAEARANADSAMIQRKIAEEQTIKAQQNAALAHRQSLELKKYAALAQVQTKEALVQKNIAENKKEDFEKQLVKNVLKNEEFYFSSAIDQDTKEEIIDSLFNTPSFDAKQIQLRNYIDLNILKLINAAVKAKENVNNDPAGSLDSARQIWNASRHPVIKKLLLSIVNDNIFSEQAAEVATSVNLNNINLAVSDSNGFAFNNGNQLVTGKVTAKKLLINEKSVDVPVSKFLCNPVDSTLRNKNFAWLGFIDSKAPIAVVDSFLVRIDNSGNVNTVDPMPVLNNYNAVQLSPDGQTAVLLDRDGNLSLKTIAANAEIIDTVVGNYRNKLTGNEGILFSPNGEYIFLNIEDKPRIINRKNKVTGMPDWSNENIAAVAFAADSRQTLVLADGKISVRDSSLSNKKAGFSEIDLGGAQFTQSSIEPAKVNSITLSRNWKKMLMGQKDGKVYLLENGKGDSLFVNSTAGDNNRLKQVGSNRSKLKAAFYNDSTIISVNDDGHVNTWNIYRDFESTDSALASVVPAQDFGKMLEDGQLNLQQVIQSRDAIAMNAAAKYFFSMEDIDSAKLIYRELLDNAHPEMKLFYLGKLVEMNVALNNVARINSSFNSNRKEYNAIREYRSERVKRLQENVTLIKQQAALCPQNNAYKEDLSTAYGSLSFNQLFLKDFSGAVKSAEAGLQLSRQKNDWIFTNLALGYLLTGRFAQAEVIYRDFRDDMFFNKTSSFKKSFLADFKDLEDAGILNDLDQSYRDEVAKIKEILEPALQPVNKIKRKGV